MKGFLRLFALFFVLVPLSQGVRAEGPRPVTVELRGFFYGNNTEFLDNSRIDGGTDLGEQVALFAMLPAAKNVRVRLGVQGEVLAGDSQKFHSIWPIIALEVGGPKNTFIMGTLRSAAFGREPSQGLWPDASGPHGLVPPLQVDTLTFTESNDAGLQWIHASKLFALDVWVAWRQLCTESQREKFDVGVNALLIDHRMSRGFVGLAAQGHVVHKGGQLTHVDTVGDSLAGGPGIQGEYRIGPGVFHTEAFVLFSKHNPDRGDHARADHLSGRGVFLRTTYEFSDWRGAWIMWRGADFIKWNGDPNYGALLNDDQQPFPAVTRATCTYHEFSLSKRFMVGNDVALVANGRIYRVDKGWDYAYRVAASVRIRRVFGGGK